MTKLGTLKQGDTLAFYIDLKAGTTTVTGAASKLRCQVRNSSNTTLFGELEISEVEGTAGRYLFKTATAGETQDWTTGDALMDIQYTDGDVVKSTETLKITVEKDVTRDE